MNFLKYTSYLYLVFGIYFLYDGYTKWNTNESPLLYFIFGGLAIFMFFFRRNFAKKFEDRNKQS
ncbi:hypothetical protein C8C85_2117 [Flavobacterium sp. 103]|uniref:hypothetical protein n=1 Tax=unclassified Flavobacterium TaxID=196869 RepID=UPI000D5F94A7|nr:MULTISPECIES: hypothetical protein [unclassified Flavobacterium]PVX46275.1 hypothetical protein C8C85_2117 [Flavobacterium sp. 103]QKJ61605.1 hypothetical protein HQN62_00155 [Flavobacterium sp. M31R6]